MRRLAAALLAALLVVSCARTPAADEPVRTAEPVGLAEAVRIAERRVERFRELFNDDIGSVVPELMGFDDAATVEWGTWLERARARLGSAGKAELIGSDVVRTGTTTSVELRYATYFSSAARVRELFVVRLDGTSSKIAFWMWWWP